MKLNVGSGALRLAAGALFVAFLFSAPSALAQSAGGPPTLYNQGAGSLVPATVVQQVGLDAITHNPCLLGQSLTCQVPSGPLYQYTPLGCGQLTGLSSATLLSTITTPAGSGIPTGARLASISVETASIRYRDDGTAPTASVGNPLGGGTNSWPYTGSLTTLQLIQQNSGAVVDVCFYK